MNSALANAANVSVLPALTIPPDVAAYCQAHGLMSLVELSARIASGIFKLAGPMEVELQTDPDSDEVRPALIAPITATVDEASIQYDAYVRRWIELVAPEHSLEVAFFPSIVGSE